MDTPRKTKLYNQIAKDYAPKHADMMICRYIEEMEARFTAQINALEVAQDDDLSREIKGSASTRKPRGAASSDDAADSTAITTAAAMAAKTKASAE